MDWEASEIVEQESVKVKRWIKESIHIRADTPTVICIGMREHTSYLPYGPKSSPLPSRGGEGPRQSDFARFKVAINTYRRLLKTPGTF